MKAYPQQTERNDRRPTRVRGVALGVLGVYLLGALAVQADIRTFTGAGYWSDPNRWTGTLVPTNGESAIIDGVCTNNGATALLASLTVNSGKTLTFDGFSNTVVTATVVTIYGTLTHTPNTAAASPWNPDKMVYMECSNLTVVTNGFIDLNDKGYAREQGPGRGTGFIGAGHGGRGGQSDSTSGLGLTYDTAAAPGYPGSSGAISFGGHPGGFGGGLVRINATGEIRVDGTIRANGSAGDGYVGGGSGGGIYLSCRTFAGSTSGVVSATGGSPASGCGGGGGRIAVVYDVNSQTSLVTQAVRFTAAGGTGGSRTGDVGTLYFPDAKFLTPLMTHAGQLVIPGCTNWGVDSLTISNAWLQFPNEGFVLTVTNDFKITGAGAGLELGQRTLCNVQNYTWDCYSSSMTTGLAVSVGGNLLLTNGASLYIACGVTNTTNPYGATINVAGDVFIGAGSWIQPFSQGTNGGSAYFWMRNLTIAPGGGFDADARGYRGGQGTSDGYGPGRGKGQGGGNSGGGGYGGTGGMAVATSYGWTYGSSNAPVDAGSSGGGLGGGFRPGANGGGVVWLSITNRLTLNGTVRARGNPPADTTWAGGGGAGGTIYMRCDTLGGTNGTVQASGSNGGTGGTCGSGGGGRIAIWRAYDEATPSAWIVAVGGGTAGKPGGNGTLVWGQLPAGPTVDNSTGACSMTYFTATLNGTLARTGTSSSIVSVFWGPTDGGTNKTAWTNEIDFGGQVEGTALSTNLAGLTPGSAYFYRFYGSNTVAERWAVNTTNFSTPASLPIVSNAVSGATGISLTAATLNGSLISTGTAPTMVSVFWGPTDGSTNMTAWANTNAFAGYVGAGSFATNVTFGVSNSYYYYTFYATNAGGEVWATPSVPFFAGSVTLVATKPNAVENGPNNSGIFAVYRPAAVTNLPVTVNYAISGTASNGVDYALLPGSTVIPAGATSNTITIAPIMDAVFDTPNKWVALTLTSGAYAIGSPSNDTVTIQDVAPLTTNTWTGAGIWTNRANWSDAIEPFGGQNVSIAGGTATLASASASLANFTLATNATLVFSGASSVLTATNVFIAGTVTHNPETVTNAPWTIDDRVFIVCSNLTLTTNGTINVNQMGFGGGTPATFVTGYGPGGGAGSTAAAGGGYGGVGGNGTAVYGPTNAPAWPGSGGGSGGGGSGRLGGAGGGLVIIQASGNVGIEGSITARGGDAGDLIYGGAGGSGGGVYLACRTFSATLGRISADGGTGGSQAGGGGGGGRIAVVYDPTAQGTVSPSPAPRLSAAPGIGLGSGAPGTVYVPDIGFYPYTAMQDSAFVVAPNLTNWSVDSLTLANAWIRFPDGFSLKVTNSLQVSGSSGRLELRNLATLNCGSLLLTNSATMYIYSGPTNPPTWTNYGAKVDVAGSMVLGTNSWIYPVSDPYNGGSVWFHAQSVTIATNAGFNASTYGYAGGNTALDGYGPGHGKGAASSVGGGGYGGTGGFAVATTYGWTYGSSNAPVDPGSGGGGLAGHGAGGSGGGLVHLEVDNTLTLNGTIRADGQNASAADWGGGGGSGGGIYIRCVRFGGVAPILSAVGGYGGYNYCGGGGGGRIAIWRSADMFSTITTNVGGGSGLVFGATGTVVWGTRSAPGTVFSIQ